MKAIKYFIFSAFCVGVAVILVIFINQNDSQVQLCFAKSCTRQGYLSGYILISFFAGMIFSGLFLLIPILKLKSTSMSLKKQMKKYEKEVQILRNQPLDDIPSSHSVEVAKLVDEDEKRSLPHHLQTS